MNPNQMQAPPSAEGPMPPASNGPPEPQGDPAQAHYRTPDARCYNCENFQDPSTCTKGVNGGQVEPEGGCDLFEMVDDDGDDQGGDQGGAPPMQGPPPGAPPA